MRKLSVLELLTQSELSRIGFILIPSSHSGKKTSQRNKIDCPFCSKSYRKMLFTPRELNCENYFWHQKKEIDKVRKDSFFLSFFRLDSIPSRVWMFIHWLDSRCFQKVDTFPTGDFSHLQGIKGKERCRKRHTITKRGELDWIWSPCCQTCECKGFDPRYACGDPLGKECSSMRYANKFRVQSSTPKPEP